MVAYLAAHRLGLVCMAATRKLRWHAIANLKGGYIEGLRVLPSAFS